MVQSSPRGRYGLNTTRTCRRGLAAGRRWCRSRVPIPTAPTQLLTGDDIAAVRTLYQALGTPAVRGHRSLQTALRRLVQAGSQTRADDRLLDAIISGEALFLQRDPPKNRGKRRPLAERAAQLLADDPVLLSPGAVIADLLQNAYEVRNAIVHGDDDVPVNVTRLDGQTTTRLDDLVDDTIGVLSRAAHLAILGAR